MCQRNVQNLDDMLPDDQGRWLSRTSGGALVRFLHIGGQHKREGQYSLSGGKAVGDSKYIFSSPCDQGITARRTENGVPALNLFNIWVFNS